MTSGAQLANRIGEPILGFVNDLRVIVALVSVGHLFSTIRPFQESRVPCRDAAV